METRISPIESVMKDIHRTLWYSGAFGGVEIGMNPMDKAKLASIKLACPGFDTGGISAFKSLREMYTFLTGDSDISGRFYPNKVSADLRACMDFSSGSFPNFLAAGMNAGVTKLYRAFPYREDVLISEKKPARDFRAIDSIQLEYPEDLSTVDPETGDYHQMAAYADAVSHYSISTRGQLVSVTRKLILNDRIDLVRQIINRVARAAIRTHARYVWSFFADNVNCPDGTAWFTGGHGNLANDALDITPLVTAITALANMTEPAPSSNKIGFDLASFDWHLVVPVELWDLAVRVNQTTSYFTANDLTTKVANPCLKLFGDRNERIVVCQFLTDTNDWGLIRDKEDVGLVEMSYLSGKEDPELIIQSGPTEEWVFMRDKITYKWRHEFGGALINYRGGYKSIVA